MENKVVLHVMGMDSSKYGGIERFNVRLSQALWDKGFRSVFVYETYPDNESFVSDVKAAHGQIVVLKSRKQPLTFCRQLSRLIGRERPCLVHAHFTKARFYAIPLAYMKGVRRLFFTLHSAMDPKNTIKPFTRLWYAMANKMAKVIAVSDNIESTYKADWPEAETKRIYLGVERIVGDKHECRSRLGISEHQMMVLTVANFNHIKGLDVLCKAIALLKERGGLKDDVCFYIVGQLESDRKELNVLVFEEGIGDFVKMVGISNDVLTYMCASDLYVQPSRSEGLPLALMEASSSGLPLVGTRVGGIPEIVKEGVNGLLVESENEEQLADAVDSLIHDAGLREKLGKNSLSVYENEYSVENGVRQTMEYYEL